jgi:hypothetical protein
LKDTKQGASATGAGQGIPNTGVYTQWPLRWPEWTIAEGMHMQLDKSFAHSSDFPKYTFFYLSYFLCNSCFFLRIVQNYLLDTTYNLTILNLDRGSGQLLLKDTKQGASATGAGQGIPNTGGL